MTVGMKVVLWVALMVRQMVAQTEYMTADLTVKNLVVMLGEP